MEISVNMNLKNVDFIRIYKHIINRLQVPNRLEEDVRQEAYLTLEKTKKRFDPQRGTKFTTYLYAALLRSIRNFLQKQYKYENFCRPMSHKLFVEDPSNPFQEIDSLDLFESLSISDTEKEDLKKRFFESKVYREIGQDRDISKQAVEQRLHKIYSKIKDDISKLR